ncbi:4-hydroxy-2-oxovalerate aldolase [Hyphococcus sp.]|uniref:4-hydroxy-2-oxovalerate aldolase n=1 Tax=Hyphococcus sp. TaxID=2038636 RepID=UPI0035C6E1E4
MGRELLKGREVILHDMTLRDGMHAKREQISLEQMIKVATALDGAGVPLIQVTHGAGLGGNSLQHGFAMHTNEEYLQAVAPLMKQALISVLLIPGMGTMVDLQSAFECGARSVHVATHCTEADTSPQHIDYARKLGMDTSGFLMMAHLVPVDVLVEQAKMMESYGAETIYITDSAGYMLPDDVKEQVRALRDSLKPETEVGFHGHHNLGMGIANSIVAIKEGASRIDASLAGLGAGAGNTPLEVLVAVCERMSIQSGCELFALMDAAEELVVPMMDHQVRVDRSSLTIGFVGVYSSFLLHAKRVSEEHGVPARDILVELGRLKMIGGQEDMIEDTALTMLKRNNNSERSHGKSSSRVDKTNARSRAPSSLV